MKRNQHIDYIVAGTIVLAFIGAVLGSVWEYLL